MLSVLLLLPGGCRTPNAHQVETDPTEWTFYQRQPEQIATTLNSATGRFDWPVVPAAYHEQPPREAIPVPPPPTATPRAAATSELSLQDAIRFMLASNPDLVSASEQIAIADATLARARAEFYPKLGASEQYGVTNNPVNAFSFQLNQAQLSLMQNFNDPRVIDDFHTQLRLQHRIYAGEQRVHEMHAASAEVSAAVLSLEALHNQLVFRVAEAYYRLLQANDLVQVRREAVEQVEQHLKIVESRYRNETAVKSDVLTVEVRLAEVREALISAGNQLELAWAVLENVTGSRIERTPLPATVPAAPWSGHVAATEVAVEEALRQRSELGALANQRQAAEEGVLVAEASKRLSVDLVTDYDVYTGDFRRGNDSFFAGLVFQLNLFVGGRTSSDVAGAAARVREIEARERRLVLDIELDVRRAYLQLNDAEARLKVATQAIGQAQESLREIEVRYRGQTATITQLVDAQVALSNSRVRRTNAQADVEIARASLERAVGRLTTVIKP
jgi:outer membrane protein TolC